MKRILVTLVIYFGLLFGLIVLSGCRTYWLKLADGAEFRATFLLSSMDIKGLRIDYKNGTFEVGRIIAEDRGVEAIQAAQPSVSSLLKGMLPP